MNNIKQTILFALLLAFIVSCTPTKRIQKNMNLKSSSMAYIMDSKVSENKNGIAINIDTIRFNPHIMSDTTKVKREKGYFLPLILVYIWNSQNKCTLGKGTFEEDIPDFLAASLSREADRSGIFDISNTAPSEYSLDISVDSISTEGQYISSGFFYFALYIYGYSYSDIAGPANSTLRISYKLRKNDEVIHSNSFTAQKVTEPISRKYTDTGILQQDYAVSMVEAVSSNFKNIIEEIVNDLNIYFTEHNEGADDN
ncbi:MAG: hypothetical protein PHH37_06145 [Paludibacter sp.]|nr:hypothetical protein [Paludibacter sp.]